MPSRMTLMYYDRLSRSRMSASDGFIEYVNPDSLIVEGALAEPTLLTHARAIGFSLQKRLFLPDTKTRGIQPHGLKDSFPKTDMSLTFEDAVRYLPYIYLCDIAINRRLHLL